MKKTAITISMMNHQNGEQRMTSIEIAELTGKNHCDVLRAIRKMESAWEKVQGSKFACLQKTYDLPNGGKKMMPYYSLSKIETLYIATKFNDEARAKLVIRWEQLEHERLVMQPMPKKEIRLLACDEEVLDEADLIIGEELEELNRASAHCYTPTEIGKVYGIEGRDLNSFLADKGIIRWACGQWQLTPKYQHRGLTENRSFIYHGRNGQRKREMRLVWTEEGRQFIKNLIG